MCASETNNFRFGGTQPGWMGEMSVPMTVMLGYSSAKSLRTRLANVCVAQVCSGDAEWALITLPRFLIHGHKT